MTVESVTATVNGTLREPMDVPSPLNVITAGDIEREPRQNIGWTKNPRTLRATDGVKSVDKDRGVNVPLIDSSEVERVGIIKGPAPVARGSEAGGGVG
ncbi:MAG: hypothetical protein LBF41_06960, partial [Deltaproteobacteria bacterium]|nr:hypothetical protein [Deltaproteobacteria bacterium]